MPAASNGALAGNASWGYECPQHRDLLVDMGPDRGGTHSCVFGTLGAGCSILRSALNMCLDVHNTTFSSIIGVKDIPPIRSSADGVLAHEL